jgi:hypothetical protein
MSEQEYYPDPDSAYEDRTHLEDEKPDWDLSDEDEDFEDDDVCSLCGEYLDEAGYCNCDDDTE